VGIAGFALGVGYALFVRFYHAAGGIGFGVDEVYSERMRWGSYLAGLLILVGATACLVLTQPALRTFPSWFGRLTGQQVPPAVMVVICVAPSVAGGLYAIGHGFGGAIALAVELAGLGVGSVFADTSRRPTGHLLWLLAFYSPWFFGMGLCLVGSAIGYLRQTGVTRRTAWITTVVFATAGAAMATLFALAMLLHWEWTVA
jgi:hypothetical protein